MLILYILLGVTVWCLIGYISAYVAWNYNIIQRSRVYSELHTLILSGAALMFVVLYLYLESNHTVNIKEKLKFKEKENK